VSKWQNISFEEIAMDFIERLFGVSPDGGNGDLELCLFAALLALSLAITWWKYAPSRQELRLRRPR
jgi:hypothetical protein